MNKRKVLAYINSTLDSSENLVGYFYSQRPPRISLFFIYGPFSMLVRRHYHVAVTDKGVSFHRTNLLGARHGFDFFAYDEIESANIGYGILWKPMTFQFKNGRRLWLWAQKWRVWGSPKAVDEDTISYLQSHIRQAV